MATKMGIENLKKLLAVPIEVGNVIPEVAKATGIIGKARAIGALTDEIFDLATLDWQALKKEWDDRDEAEKAELCTFFKQKLDLPDDNLEQIIEEAFNLIITQVELGVNYVELADKIKSLKKP